MDRSRRPVKCSFTLIIAVNVPLEQLYILRPQQNGLELAFLYESAVLFPYLLKLLNQFDQDLVSSWLKT